MFTLESFILAYSTPGAKGYVNLWHMSISGPREVPLDLFVLFHHIYPTVIVTTVTLKFFLPSYFIFSETFLSTPWVKIFADGLKVIWLIFWFLQWLPLI